MRAYCSFMVATTLALLPGCNGKEPLDSALLGKWSNVDQGQDTIAFRDDGSLEIAGLRKRDLIRGDYEFLDDDNVEMTFHFPESHDWRPRWMPPGMKKDPNMRAYVRFFGDVLELRPRAHIKTGDVDQYVEFGVLRFDRVAELAD
jgi:hypothetical protein